VTTVVKRRRKISLLLFCFSENDVAETRFGGFLKKKRYEDNQNEVINKTIQTQNIAK
jgi:hypothetical protein